MKVVRQDLLPDTGPAQPAVRPDRAHVGVPGHLPGFSACGFPSAVERDRRGGGGSGYDSVALALQGGGALGAYQVGAYQALREAGFDPDWLVGISIGAINAALIAGNPPEQRLAKLREFWRLISHPSPLPWWPTTQGTRIAHNLVSAAQTTLAGQPNFFRRRVVPPWLAPPGSPGAQSFYDLSPLRHTLLRLVDFDLVNHGPIRLTLGAVNVSTGQQRFFDSSQERIGVEHVLASAALPPVFAPVEIDGEQYWDGGIVSNTPLDAILETQGRVDTLCFVVQLFPTDGRVPRNIEEVASRLKDMTYASREDVGIRHLKEKHDLRRAVDALVRRLPPHLRDDPEVQALWRMGCTTTTTVVRLVHRPRGYELDSRDYEFSRLGVEEHLRSGYDETRQRCAWIQQAISAPDTDTPVGVIVHDPDRQDDPLQHAAPPAQATQLTPQAAQLTPGRRTMAVVA